LDPSKDDNIAICIASEKNHTNIVRLLLSHEKVNPAAQDNTVLRNAISNENCEMVSDLMRHTFCTGFFSVDPFYPHNIPILAAMQKGNPKILKSMKKREGVEKFIKENQFLLNF
jgi:hypothetical protein